MRDCCEHTGALAYETFEAFLHSFKRVVYRREFADRGTRSFNDFRRPPERISRRRKTGKRRDEAASRKNRDGGDNERASEYQRKRLHQSSTRSPMTRPNREPPAIVKINRD